MKQKTEDGLEMKESVSQGLVKRILLGNFSRE